MKSNNALCLKLLCRPPVQGGGWDEFKIKKEEKKNRGLFIS
jgi:hypothetical protein